MRLIDADELLKKFDPNGEPVHPIAVRVKIVQQQTAYDVDRVVEQLKDHAIEFEVFGQCSDYVELSHAIEIVKAGGANENR